MKLPVVQIGKRKLFYWSMATLVVFTVGFGIFVADYLDEQELAALPGQLVAPPEGKISLLINVRERRLKVLSDEQLYKTYRVAVGKSETPTPVGEWNIVWKDYNWGTGFGTRWLGLNVPWGTYGIHGTNKPWSLGSYASHGCIRMRNADVEELFEWAPVGTPVKIEGAAVRVGRILRHKTSGQDVAIVQLKLKDLGFFEGRADGIFGLQTVQAVKQFQEAQGLASDGVVSQAVLEALGIEKK